MENKVIIRCTKGKEAISNGQREWIYTEPNNILIGRSKDNHIATIDEGEYKRISRFQAQFTVRPPQIYVKDFGSKNGTFVNGRCIGKRKKDETPEEGQKRAYPLYELKNGDVFSIGGVNALVEFKVEIQAVPDSYAPTDEQKLEEKDLYRIKNKNAALVKKSLLGEGGFGAVYSAIDVNTKKRYAIKELKPEVKISDKMIRYFQREADVLKQLEHPNIIKVYENYFDRRGENLCIVMEFCPGGDLANYVMKRGGKLRLEEATNIILTLLEALDYVHNKEVKIQDAKGRLQTKRGLVHRDIKPQNVLFGEDGSVKLTDFGLAKAFDLAGASGLSSDNQWFGTFPYLSRRQLLAFRYSKPDVDVFAMAAMYYQLLTGSFIRDFTEKDVLEPQVAVLKKKLVPIRERKDSIPVELAHVIDGVLQEENNGDTAYFTSAKTFAKKIRQALNMR